jgi:hypothetical protein
MWNFLETFAGTFPEIDNLTALHKAAQEAAEVELEKAPKKPSPVARSVPRQMPLERDHIVALGEAMGLSPDEIVIIFTSAIKYADNPIIVDAFKKLVSATKLCTDVNDCLTEHHDELREEDEQYESEVREWKKRMAAHKKETETRDQAIASTKAAYRRAWLKMVRELEDRVNAAGGETMKMREDDAYLYRRAKKGTKANDPFAFLRNQKGDKCIQILSECRHDLERKLIDRGIKKALKLIKDRRSLEQVLDDLDPVSANYVFDAYVRKSAYMKMHPDGYIDFDSYAVHNLLAVGDARGLKAAEGWREHLDWLHNQKEDRWFRRSKGSNHHLIDAYRQLHEAMMPEADF